MRTLETTLGFASEGTALVRKALAVLDEESYGAPSPLPGWTRKHVVAHLAGNAEAIGNLVHWARTGEPTPMYSSPEQRTASIEAGAQLPGSRLTAWFEESAEKLSHAMAQLAEEQWKAEVVTAQGRTVPVSETPWMRSREVMVHAVDLGTGLRFADLPEAFLAELREDILARRGRDSVPAVHGSPAEITAYLAGRPYTGVATADGAPAQPLTPWL
ncbi:MULTISPECIES: maleylpyruvate isomerase family mycothiol-dependent enzyme [Streptomyces]|uniref:Maleylpyruvate isomerase family mycothiol-dependent enzyme n=1 Tax=Streptomyces dengpaensis TaxID=2049881 RepID=A0ABM6SN65_9ACTN|nr:MULTISPECIES: maleylpyruvate isomerase family mycothiol-dependent enzyme [Streptomyces]AVH56094.1 maleylpyruvate isomerase family mycothiol-dependent enzyme [Streptomyces dengpaensis]PIB06352.1 maleylpyruvate isomerase [Streptomyces sp. HG99]